MLKPQGYIAISDPVHTVERDSITCGHCSRVVFVKPGTAATIYLIPQFMAEPKEEAGAMCRQCMRHVCLTCHADGRCLPLERRIEQMEARGRFLSAVGL